MFSILVESLACLWSASTTGAIKLDPTGSFWMSDALQAAVTGALSPPQRQSLADQLDSRCVHELWGLLLSLCHISSCFTVRPHEWKHVCSVHSLGYLADAFCWRVLTYPTKSCKDQGNKKWVCVWWAAGYAMLAFFTVFPTAPKMEQTMEKSFDEIFQSYGLPRCSVLRVAGELACESYFEQRETTHTLPAFLRDIVADQFSHSVATHYGPSYLGAQVARVTFSDSNLTPVAKGKKIGMTLISMKIFFPVMVGSQSSVALQSPRGFIENGTMRLSAASQSSQIDAWRIQLSAHLPIYLEKISSLIEVPKVTLRGVAAAMDASQKIVLVLAACGSMKSLIIAVRYCSIALPF